MLFRKDRGKHTRQAQADLAAAQRGDARAFSRLAAAHQNQIYTLSYRALGNEAAAVAVAQAGVGQAARNIGRFHTGHFQLWLLQWVVLACRERLREAAPAPALPEPGGAPLCAAQASLCRLPANLRLALILVEVT